MLAEKAINEKGDKPLFTLTLSEIEPILKKWVYEVVRDSLPTSEKQDLFYTRDEVCELLQVSQSTLTNYLKSGKLTGRKVGGRVLFFKTDILNALKEYGR